VIRNFQKRHSSTPAVAGGGSMVKNMPSKFVRDAFRALQIAAAKALDEYKRAGDPVYVWEKGKVVRIPPHRIRVSHVR
jgi:hypothetical protein